MELVIGTLILLVVGQQAYYGFIVNKLINKLMSRNYGEYEASKPAKQDLKVKLDQGIPEDLAYLNNMDPRFTGLR